MTDVHLTPSELRDDVIVALMEQGYPRAAGMSAVSGLPISDFSTMFRAALESLTHARKNGKLPESSEEKCGCGRPLVHRGQCHYRRDQRAKRKPKIQSISNANARPSHEETPSDAPVLMATLRVNEQQLNQFLIRLPLGEKECLAQFYLNSQQGESA